ncbi:histidine kinase [Dyadobacter sp. CY327]|uniref:ligand-binding sensor domain-containing protein n=1 Tax=Dyadobacter sp. CY327 TaxID=2907301 RepID=UPI001F408A47|nr:two-component regulator propeller domain-containing protein [Dyadobacter sp. CY327]MCE7071892.1 histidine kinase [Dyadobacter sp. CY327]
MHKDKFKSEAKELVTFYGPNAMVRNVKECRNGTILIAASFAGVFRYNGKSFANLTSQIGTRRFWDVLEDRSGNHWIATTDSGVYYYPARLNDKVEHDKSLASRQGGFQHFTTKEGLASNAVMSIYEDKAGFIWFGTAGGVSRYDPRRAGGKSFQNFTMKDGLPNNGITTIMEDKNGKLWIGSRGEACFYDGKTFTVFRNKDGKAFNNVWGITEDKKGNIWFGATTIEEKKGDTLIVTAGLWRYDGSVFIKINQRGTSAIIEDIKGNIWTTGAVNPNGVGPWKLLRYDQKSLYNKNPVVTEIMSTEKMLCGILEANDGSIWFGSMNGVYRYDGKNITDFKRKVERR